MMTSWFRSLQNEKLPAFLLLLLAAMLPANICFADTETIILKDSRSELIDIKPNTLHLIDRSLELTLEDVANQPGSFEPITSKYVDFGLGDFRVWLKAVIYDPSDNSRIWRLDTGRPFSEEIDVYIVAPGQPVMHALHHKETDAFSARKIESRTLTTDFAIPANEVVEVYISFKSNSTTALALKFGTPSAVVKSKSNETVVDSIVNGALLAMLGLSLIFVPITGWRLSLAFGSYIFFGIFYVSHADGYTAQYVWPHLQVNNDAINLILMLSMSICGFNFARILFDFKNRWPAYNRFMLGYIGVALFFALLAYPLIKVPPIMVIAYLIVPIGALIQPITGILVHRRGYLGAAPYIFGSLLVLISFVYAFVAHIFPGQFNLDRTLDVGHAALLGEGFAFAGAIVARLLGIQRERDAASEAELVAVKEKLAMSTALRSSQKQYLEARDLSQRRREQLSSVSHDLQQPMVSLRRVITELSLENDDAGNQLHSALDYLEKLARDQFEAVEDDSINLQSDGTIEVFPVNVVLRNAYEMFKAEAKEKGLDFRIRGSDDLIQSDAVSLMRVINNLLKNAITHTDSGGILLATRTREDHVSIEVYDTGNGVSDSEMSRIMKRREKGKDSEGSGLGLAIVQEISSKYDLKFTLNSEQGRGTRAKVTVPRHL